MIDVRDVDGAVIQVALTSRRNIIGRHTLDDVQQNTTTIIVFPSEFVAAARGIADMAAAARQ